MKIVFMGTPDFAVNGLEALLNAGHEITGVFTQPDKPQGRKMVLTPPPVKVFAENNGLKVFQPTTVRTDEAFQLLKSLEPDLIAVVAYGKIIPENILNLPKYGCVNVHASLLPRHRGASPIQTSILVGDKVTGVTTQQMDVGIDTGDILMAEECDILPTDNFETLHDKLAVMGAKLLVDTVEGLEKGAILPQKQSEDGVTHCSIITKEMGLVDFNKTACEIDCLIRAFTPWPSAYFFMNGKRVKVISATLGDKTSKAAGTVIDTKNALVVACGEGTSLVFNELQPEGKGKMTAKALLNGYPLEIGTVL
jgi:methionyl-tRNA formyltransferase